MVCLFNSTLKKPDILAAFSISEFKLNENEAAPIDFKDITEFIKLPSEEAKLCRFMELSEGKREKLRCGCRGYICLICDERRLEVYEITD